MRFKSLVKKVGFGTAVYLAEDQLTDDFFNALTLKQWVAIYSSLDVPQDCPLRHQAWRYILRNAKTLEDWRVVGNSKRFAEHAASIAETFEELDFARQHIGDPKKESELLERMTKLAASFEEWKRVCELSCKISSDKADALCQMAKKASSFDDLKDVRRLSDEVQQWERPAIKDRMIEFARTFKDWQLVEYVVDGLNGKALACWKMFESATTLDELQAVYDAITHMPSWSVCPTPKLPSKKSFDARIKRCPATFDELLHLYYSNCFDEIAVRRLKSHPEASFARWLAVLESSQSKTGIGLDMILSMRTSQSNLHKLLQAVSNVSDKPYREIQRIIERMAETAKTFSDWWYIYECCRYANLRTRWGDQDHDRFLDEMRDKAYENVKKLVKLP